MVGATLAVLRDCERNIPFGVEEKDFLRITQMTKDRGRGFLTTDLPHIDSVLTNGLEVGRATFSGPLMGLGKSGVPKFLSGLWSRVFDKTGSLLDVPDVDAIFFLRQISCLWKSLFEVCPDRLVNEAVKDYCLEDDSIRRPTLSWKGDELDAHKLDDLRIHDVYHPMDDDHHVLPFGDDFVASGSSRLSSSVHSALDRLEQLSDELSTYLESEWARESAELSHGRGGAGFFKPGPGSISNLVLKKDKYLIEAYPSRLEKHFPYHLVTGGFSTPRLLVVDSIRPSKLIAVPKTATKPRLICSEPNEMMWSQQHIWNWFRDLRHPYRRFIDFRDQSESRHLAYLGSLDRGLSTIDLKSASDRISLYVLERLFRRAPSFLRAVHACRSPYIQLPSGEVRWKVKAFSQGTALTFPIQSIIFLLVTLAANGVSSFESPKCRRLIGKVRVFGDDIVTPTTGFEDVSSLLTLLGLKVSSNKSFTSGYFRESCGGDYYRGYDVTPLRLRSLDPSSPVGLIAMVDNANNAFRKGPWQLSVYLERLADRELPVRRLTVPLTFFSFCGDYDPPSLKRRWNHNTQQYEVRTISVRNSSRTQDVPWVSRILYNLTANPLGDQPSSYRVLETSRQRFRISWVRSSERKVRPSLALQCLSSVKTGT